MLSRTVVLVALLACSAQADIFEDVKGLTSDVGDFFNKHFQNVKDLFANNQDELDKNINRVKDLLTTLKDKAKALEPLANDSQKATLAKVDEFIGQIDSFQNEAAAAGQDKFQQTKTKWEELVTKIFNTERLKDVMKLLNVNPTSSTVTTFSLAAFAVVITVFA